MEVSFEEADIHSSASYLDSLTLISGDTEGRKFWRE